ncbi:MAG: hypothetical protein KAR19_18945 [Bacteroidales bacterium]|nr:hypothetical protein [Bacteroidales bacterium]
MIDFLFEIKGGRILPHKDLFLIQPQLKTYIKKNRRFILYLWGDPIFDPEFDLQRFSEVIRSFITEITQKVQGHYYFIIFDKKTNDCYSGNSLFSIPPLYFAIHKEKLYLSSSPEIIANHLNLWIRDKRFILENILFNYPLFNHSAFEKISLLPANNYLKWEKGELSTQKHIQFEDYFSCNIRKPKKDLDHLSDLFIDRSSIYFPDNMYIHALTGGFDGRTLVACAKYHNKNFETYSFGSSESTDTQVAKSLSGNANIAFNHFLLDKEYIDKQSFSNGVEFVLNSSGTATFARAHYLFSAKELSKKANFLVTGNFGSEIFRAAHIAGTVISANLYRLFKAKSLDDAIFALKSSQEYNWLNNICFKREWESLIEDLKDFPAFASKFKSLTLNQKFYLIVFEEVFRKYFGAEIKNQHLYLINRTPFLDFQFFNQLLQSQLAGIHSDFFEHNPLKRYKGQMLYSYIIRKAYPEFSHIAMDKGYKPVDLLTSTGKFRITKAYIKKRALKQKASLSDPFAVKASFVHNKNQLEKEISNSQLFDIERLEKSFINNETNNSFFIALSQAIYFNKVKSR